MARSTELETFFAASSRAAYLDALAEAERDPHERLRIAARAELALIEGRLALQNLAEARGDG